MTSIAPTDTVIPRELQYKVLVIGEYGVGKYNFHVIIFTYKNWVTTYCQLSLF